MTTSYDLVKSSKVPTVILNGKIVANRSNAGFFITNTGSSNVDIIGDITHMQVGDHWDIMAFDLTVTPLIRLQLLGPVGSVANFMAIGREGLGPASVFTGILPMTGTPITIYETIERAGVIMHAYCVARVGDVVSLRISLEFAFPPI